MLWEKLGINEDQFWWGIFALCIVAAICFAYAWWGRR
jgi:hypothetical protein